MAFTREEAYAALASLNPAPVFLQAYHTERLPENLHIYFGVPEEFFIASDSEEPYTHGQMIPILDDGNFGIVTFLNPTTHELVQLDIESPGEERAVFRNWQQFLADLLILMGESGVTDEKLQRIAGLVGFAHTDALFAFFERIQDANNAEYRALREQFVASISEGS